MQPDKTGLDPANKWTFSSTVKKYVWYFLMTIFSRNDPHYNLTVSFVNGATNEETAVDVLKTIDNFFDTKGKLCHKQLEDFILGICKDLPAKKKK